MDPNSFRLQFLLLLQFIFTDYKAICLPLKQDRNSLTTSEVLTYLVQYGYLEDRQNLNQPLMITAPPSNAVDSTKSNKPLPIMQQQQQVTKRFTSSPPRSSNPGSNSTNLRQSRQFSDSEIETALYDYQRFMDIPLTGMLDKATSADIRQPRCGMKDKLPHLSWTPLRREQRRRRRYVVQGSKWNQNTLTYTIAKRTLKLSFQEQNDTIYKAIRIWSEIIPVTFHWTDDNSKANVVISFLKGDHGDKMIFDGKGFNLAHAFYPGDKPLGGHIHFDDDEDWAMGNLKSAPKGKVSLLLIALHELGHVLGLHHSNVRTALMFPLYSPKGLGRKKKPRRAVLDPDDIAGIQSLYGKCSPRINSIFSWMGDGKTYVFKGDYFWKIDDVAKEAYPGYPQPINSMWKGIPHNFDEAFLWGLNWKTYFFKGKYYYRYHDSFSKVDDYYPKLISDGWPGIPDNIDAAFTWSNHVSYFFKDHLCYRFDNTNNRVYQGYPKNISEVWPGIPSKIDTVFRYYWDGSAYFFSGHEYWKLDAKTSAFDGPFKIDNGWKNICLI